MLSKETGKRKVAQKRSPSVPAPGASGGHESLASFIVHLYGIQKNAACQENPKNLSKRTTCENLHKQYTTPPQNAQPLKIAEQAKQAMDAADAAGDLDAWVDAFTTYLSVFRDAYPPAELTGNLSTDIDIVLQQLERHRRLAHHYGQLAELHTSKAAALRVQLSELETLIPGGA